MILPFLWRGVIFVSLRFWKNFVYINVKFCRHWTVKVSKKKITKNTYTLFYNLWRNIGALRHLFHILIRNKYWTSFLLTLVKLKLDLLLPWFAIATILGWFLYFRIAIIVESLKISKKGLLFEYLVRWNCGTMFAKKII